MSWTIANNHSSDVSVAIMFYSPETCSGDYGGFETMGWWNISPGSSAVVYGNDLNDVNEYWYYYAKGTDGTVWGGNYDAYVNPEAAFDGCSNIGTSTWENVGFQQLDVTTDNYTLTLA